MKERWSKGEGGRERGSERGVTTTAQDTSLKFVFQF